MVMDVNRHLDGEEVERYSLRETAEPELARVEEHLLVCASCRRQVEDTDVYVQSMQQAAARSRRQPATSSRWRLVLVLAAAALLVGAILTRRSGTAPIAVSLAATRGSGVGAQAPAGVPLALHPDVTGLPPQDSYR